MKRIGKYLVEAVAIGFAVFGFLLGSASGEEFGLFTYEVVNESEVWITDYPEDATGAVVIPAEIDGFPVTQIARMAFFNCSLLISVSIPDTVTRLSYSAFADCTSLTSITMPASLTAIEGAVFASCSNLAEISLPAGLEYIGQTAFSSCSALETIALPTGLIGIESSAFSRCTSLTSITIPASVTSLGSRLLTDCSSLTMIDVAPGSTHFTAVDDVLFSFDRTSLLQFPPAQGGAYSIPSGTTLIASGAFSNCNQLTSITLPEGVETIASSAFSRCSGLTELNLPASVSTIQYDLAFGCTSLQSINVAEGNPYFVDLDGILFSSNLLHLIQFPPGRSGTYTVPPGVVEIGVRAFASSAGLTAIQVPQTTSIIGNNAFQSCTALTKMHLPDNLDVLGRLLFQSCTALREVTLPRQLDRIDWLAFLDCSELRSVTFLGDAIGLSERTFEDAHAEFTIYYLPSKPGFTSPTWEGHPSIALDEATYPAAGWLLAYELPVDTGIRQDPNAGGVDLLMEYALNLAPDSAAGGTLVDPYISSDGRIYLRFFAAAPGINYRVEASTDLKEWTTEGVLLSNLNSSNERFGRISLADGDSFLRLVVEMPGQ